MRTGQASNVGLILTAIVVVSVFLVTGMVGVGFLVLRSYMADMAPTHLAGPTQKTPAPPPDGSGQPPPPPPAAVLVGQPAPEIEGEDIDGVRFKLSDYRGKVVLLDFWGHW